MCSSSTRARAGASDWRSFGDISQTISTFMTTSYEEGVHTITATYAGDSRFAPAQLVLQQTVEVPPFGTPYNLTAHRGRGGAVSIFWRARRDVAHYELWRRGAESTAWTFLGNATTTSKLDDAASPSAAYLYRVRAVAADGTQSDFSAPDFVSTAAIVPTGAPKTVIRRADILDLREAVNALRALAGLPALTFTDAVPVIVKAIHVTELNSALNQTRQALGFGPASVVDAPQRSVVEWHILERLRIAAR